MDDIIPSEVDEIESCFLLPRDGGEGENEAQDDEFDFDVHGDMDEEEERRGEEEEDVCFLKMMMKHLRRRLWVI